MILDIYYFFTIFCLKGPFLWCCMCLLTTLNMILHLIVGQQKWNDYLLVYISWRVPLKVRNSLSNYWIIISDKKKFSLKLGENKFEIKNKIILKCTYLTLLFIYTDALIIIKLQITMYSLLYFVQIFWNLSKRTVIFVK